MGIAALRRASKFLRNRQLDRYGKAKAAFWSLFENLPRRGGQAHFAHRASQNEPVPAGFRTGC